MKKIFLITSALVALILFSSCGASSHVPVKEGEDFENGYTSISQKKNTNAISKVEAGEDMSRYNSITEYLVGKASGLMVTADGKINIRGAVTGAGRALEPLILFDGQTVTDIESINPNEVYSVDVIKDASTAMYGMSGAGGVISITSKSKHYAQQAEKERRKAGKQNKKSDKQTITISLNEESSPVLANQDEDFENGYTSISKKKNTDSISKVNAGEDLSRYNSIKEYLVGKASGLMITSDGKINIRGAVTGIGQPLEPLILFDGQTVTDIESINPNEVYSIDVIKDSSSAMYGMSGAGGVISITSKSKHFAQQAEKERRQAEKKLNKESKK